MSYFARCFHLARQAFIREGNVQDCVRQAPYERIVTQDTNVRDYLVYKTKSMTPPTWAVFSAVFENEVYIGSLDVPMGREGMNC